MPAGVFKPYTGVSTSILIFTKTNAGGTDKVWFYDMQADGYSLDDKRNLLITEEQTAKVFTTPQEIVEEVKGKCDIPAILTDWQNISDKLTETEIPQAFADHTAQSFLVPKQEIVDNGYDLSINRYKEVIYEEVHYEAPATIIATIKALDKQRQAAIVELENLLK